MNNEPRKKDRPCSVRCEGRLCNYCTILLNDKQHYECSSEDLSRPCAFWQIWLLAEKSAGRELKVPDIRQSRLALDKSHIFDLFLGSRRILAVDDSPVVLATLEKVLRPFSEAMLKAENGEVALKKIEESDDIGLVLLDLKMPVMDGFDFLVQLHDKPRSKRDFPILIVSELTDWKSTKKAIENGATGYMKKPITKEQLLDAIIQSYYEYNERVATG